MGKIHPIFHIDLSLYSAQLLLNIAICGYLGSVQFGAIVNVCYLKYHCTLLLVQMNKPFYYAYIQG